MLSPRLQLRVAQGQILTPGLVQMVTVLQLHRLESANGAEELTPE
jgi:RNA polymerase sigma-54 factor